MVCTNNLAEGPFATVRAFMHIYPSLKLRTVAGLSVAMINGTHRSKGSSNPAPKPNPNCHHNHFSFLAIAGARDNTTTGLAFTAPVRVRNAVAKVCGVRTNSLGAVTNFLRQSNVVDAVEAIVNRKASKQKKSTESARLQAGRLQNFDVASETVLAQTVDDLQTQILVTCPQCPNLKPQP
jgi:hypothetical protein